jgi:hypothetical protein
MRKLADKGRVRDYIRQWWPFSWLCEWGGFIRALLGGEDWTGLNGTDPGRGCADLLIGDHDTRLDSPHL